MPLLKDNGIYLDHYAYTDNCIGKVVEVSWSNETMQGETRIPAGIDGNFAIDKLHTTVVSNILSGALYSDSVTVSFDWKPSHAVKDGEYFNGFVGDMHQDGTMYRRIATKIHQYKEVSIVNLGADPYAKMRDENGQLMKIETTSSFSEDKTKDAYIIESVASEMLALSDRFNKQTQTNTHNSISDLSNENKADLSTSTVAQITELQTSVTAQKNEIAQLTAKCTDLEQSFTSKERVYLSEATTLKAQITTLEGEKTRLKDIETALQTTNASLISQNESLQSESKDYKVYLDLARKETLRLYQLSTNTRSATVENTIQNGSMEQLNDMIQSFGAKSLTTFGAKCGKCGSSDLNFKNSVATPLSSKATEYKDNSREAVIARLSQK